MSKYNIPFYGANKDGGNLGDIADMLEAAGSYSKFNAKGVAGDASDVDVFTAAGANLILGAYIEVSNLTGDFVATLEFNNVTKITTSGEGRFYLPAPQALANTQTIQIDPTSAAGTSADVQVGYIYAVVG